MKKISLSLITVLLLFVIFTPVALASSTTRVTDDAKVLKKEEVASLENKLQSIREKHKFDMAILTINDLEGRSIEFYAKTYYKKNKYGIGEGQDGALLLVYPEEKKYYIYKYGYGTKVFNSYSLDFIGEGLSKHIKEDKYYNAFEGYLNDADSFLLKASEGEAYSTSNPVRTGSVIGRALDAMFVVVPLALIIAVSTVLIMKRKHKSIEYSELAKGYIDEDSFNIRERSDVFLYSNTQKTRLLKSSSKNKK